MVFCLYPQDWFLMIDDCWLSIEHFREGLVSEQKVLPNCEKVLSASKRFSQIGRRFCQRAKGSPKLGEGFVCEQKALPNWGKALSASKRSPQIVGRLCRRAKGSPNLGEGFVNEQKVAPNWGKVLSTSKSLSKKWEKGSPDDKMQLMFFKERSSPKKNLTTGDESSSPVEISAMQDIDSYLYPKKSF